MKKTVLFSGRVSIGFLVIMSVCYYLFAGSLMTLFMKNESIVGYGTQFLRALCFGLPFLCMDFLAVGVFQACGMGKTALLFAILRKIILEIPALCILNWIYPLYGLAYAQFVAEVVLATAAVLILIRLFKRLDQWRKVEALKREPD